MENIEHNETCTLDSKYSNNPVLNVEDLPNEILIKIFSHLNIKCVYKCGHVNKKFRQISHDKSFWKCVNLYNQRVSCQFIAQILQLGTEYLNLHGATLLDDDVSVIPQKNNLKYLNLAFSSVEDRVLVRLLRSSVSLEKISLRDVNKKPIKSKTRLYEEQRVLVLLEEHDQSMLKLRRSWYIECLLPNAKMLTTLDLSNLYNNRYKLRSESIEGILLNCVELKEANFKGQISDLEFFVNNLTPKIEKLNISYSDGFLYKHILPLVKRCNNISELDIYQCDLDVDLDVENKKTLIAISENLSQSLVKLHLPDFRILYHEFLNLLPKLRYLWICTRDVTIMKEYPLIVLNKGTAKIAYSADEYFEPEQGFWEVKCTSVDFSKLQ